MKRIFHPVMLLVLLAAIAGCKKKQKPAPAPAAQAPTITQPETTPPVAETQPSEPAPTSENPPPVVEPAKPKPKPKTQRPVAKKPSPARPAPEAGKPAGGSSTIARSSAPPRIVVGPGSTTSEAAGTVVPDLTHTEEAHHRATTDQLMQSTEANVKSLKRVLTPNEQAMLQQINAFMAQAREATQSQDLVRAHNLALKAHLLSDELIR